MPSDDSDSSKSVNHGPELDSSLQARNNQRPKTPATQTPAAPGDADPAFVSQTQASQRSTQLKADESSGALHYDYPVQLPPGRNGLQPDLKLSYNSQNQEEGSIFGYGWTISIPSIQRKNTHGTDKLYSGFDFTSALSGDLVATNGANSTFIARIDDGEYLKYSLDANQTWTAQSKQGLTYVFGATPADRQNDPANPSHVYTWLLSSIVDSNGNIVTYSYVNDGGQVYPERISYGGIFEVSFSRITRQDPYRGYRTGFSVTSTYVVSSILVRINNSVSKTYLLSYSNNPTTNRSRLQSIAVQDALHTYPPTNFDYQIESAKGFDPTYSSLSIPIDLKSGVFPADINGDGYPDLIKAYEWIYGYYSAVKSVSINHPENNNWQIDPAWQLPQKIMIDTDSAFNRNVDSGTRLPDLNGDLKPDFLRYENICFICTTDQELNTGLGWSETTSWFSPINTNGGTRTVLDLNGDGLTDVLGTNGVTGTIQNFQTSISLNSGTDFSNYGRYPSSPPDPSMPFAEAPEYLSNYLEVDVNADGLPDLVKSSWYWGNPTSHWEKKIYLNNGRGWTEDTAWTFPDICYFCQGAGGQSYTTIYFQDFNNDGYVDFAVPGGANVNNQWLSYSNVYINNGHGWTEDTGWYSLAYFFSDNCFCQNPALFLDGNADGSPDIFVSNQSGGGPATTNIFLNRNHNQVDLLSTVTLPTGGTISATYKMSSQYRDTNGNLLNPKLPLVIQTVERITTDDKNGNISDVTYSYADGSYYYNSPFDRRFAGFGSITKTDSAGNVSKTYLHQGNENNQVLGEHGDEYWKIGRPYRAEQYDNAGHLFSKTLKTWESYGLGSNARFVKLAQTVDYSYDGNASHKDKAEMYTYDDSTGNLTQKISLGQVNGNDDGTFIDTGTDTYTTNFSYASGSSLNVVGLPSQETVLDANSNKVRETKLYYDVLPFGQVEKGNLTRREDWTSGATYIHTTKTYNALGLVIQETDPRDWPTTYTYDSFNLYPATVANALNHTTQFIYDYTCGKIKQRTDANGNVFETSYDALGRVLEEREPEISTKAPAASVAAGLANGNRSRGRLTIDSAPPLVKKDSYVYSDIGMGSSVKKTDYLDGTVSSDSYTYFDGLGRTIQTRKQTETANNFSVKDLIYNNSALLQQESLPYFSTGSPRTNATTNNALYTSYIYDALQRATSVTTALGTTTNTYDDWKLTVTDANSKLKDLFKDAYDELVRVDEHNGAGLYTTKYDYNGLGKLIKITDANNNVRNFTYDGLGRKLTGEDLHSANDVTFGQWSYNYDDSSNLTSRLDPNAQTCVYSYDKINRPKTEDFAGQAGVEVTYTYDNCTNGVGRLCSVTNSNLTQSMTFNAMGLPVTEDKTIDSVTYHTAYGYDRQGNQTQIVNPDGSEMVYQYNNAALVEQVLSGPSGAGEVVIQNIDYSPLGQVTVMQYSNGAVTTNTYDAARLYRLQHRITLLPIVGPLPRLTPTSPTTQAGAKALPPNVIRTTKVAQDLTYAYDNVGNVLSIVDASDTNARKTITYGYDDLYRLISATTSGAPNGTNYTQTYSYDAVGNIHAKSDQGTYSYEGNAGNSYANPHAVTRVDNGLGAPTTFQYDRNGNLTSTSNDLLNKWDYNNRMVQTILGEQVMTYGYDQNGQRVKYSNGFTTTVYPSRYYNISKSRVVVNPGKQPVDNAVKHIFIGEQLVATIKGTLHPAVYAVHTDHLSGSSVISNSSGQIEELTDYYPFGDIRLEENRGAFTEQRKFTGHELDAETGLTYMDARYYSAPLARFTSQDPIFLEVGSSIFFARFPTNWRYSDTTGRPGEKTDPLTTALEQYLANPQNLNAYSYALNDPVKYTDPNGESASGILDFVGGAADLSAGIRDRDSGALSRGATSLAASIGSSILRPQFYLAKNPPSGQLQLSSDLTAQKALGGLGYANQIVGAAIAAKEDAGDPNLSAGLKIGRTSLRILPGVSTVYGIGEAVAPDFTHKVTDQALKNEGEKYGNLILNVARITGQQNAFQRWASSPSCLDF